MRYMRLDNEDECGRRLLQWIRSTYVLAVRKKCNKPALYWRSNGDGRNGGENAQVGQPHVVVVVVVFVGVASRKRQVWIEEESVGGSDNLTENGVFGAHYSHATRKGYGKHGRG
ncbi:MAG: hypothetical protein BYD32DRAFT_441107 [Podila humilis]|nr:MAG: hypothetical protein BYD32DRAFT_441107 [Podila humilis]